MEFEKSDLPTWKYYGKFSPVNEGIFGFHTRVHAYDYHVYDYTATQTDLDESVSVFEIVRQKTIIFEPLIDEMCSKHKLFSAIEVLESAAQKVTQLLSVLSFLSEQFTIFHNELKPITERKYHFVNNKLDILIANIETVFYLNSSILDMMSKFHSLYLNETHSIKVPDKYGQQKSWNNTNNKFSVCFDEEFQARMLENKILNLCHDYRNSFTHETSISIVPLTVDNNIILYISKGNEPYGLDIVNIFNRIPHELHQYITFYNNHLITKYERK